MNTFEARAQSRLATSSRVLVLPNPVLARRADDMLRAFVIGVVQGNILVPVGYLCTAQYNLLLYNLVTNHLWRAQGSPFSSFIFSSWIFGMLPMILGMFIPVLRGRLGGKVTGWIWRPMIAR